MRRVHGENHTSPWRSAAARIVAVAGAVLLTVHCGFHHPQRELVEPARYKTLDDGSPWLKAHMHNGNVYLLSDWVASEEGVRGNGILYGPSRTELHTGDFFVGLDSIAVFETNVAYVSGTLAPFAIMIGVSAALTAYCLSNPKSCFGSCPTFYVDGDGGKQLVAEGFSSSISPALEATDVDALFAVRPNGDVVELEMRNEALETHVVRGVRLLAVPRTPGTRVLKAPDGALWEAFSLRAPAACASAEGNARGLVSAYDGRERFGPADSTDLSARETIELSFADVPRNGRCGLVVSTRQTLLSTYLLYQTLAYMGRDIGRWFAMGAWMDFREDALMDALGWIEVQVPDATGRWTTVGKVGEHGPLATDTWVVPLPDDFDGRARLRLTRGNWRVDYVGLAELGGEVMPQRIAPAAVWRDGRPDPTALDALLDPAAVLTTMPGDTYTIAFPLPAHGEYEIFLESTGYYLEWMREEWLAETSTAHATEMLFFTRRALRRLAPEYKRVEADMEDAFWRSRFAGW